MKEPLTKVSINTVTYIMCHVSGVVVKVTGQRQQPSELQRGADQSL